MTPKLKAAAKALQQPWSLSHDEQMTEAQIKEVDLKFVTHHDRTVFLGALEKLAPLLNLNFPNTQPLTKYTETGQQPADAGNEVWASFWYKYFLPDIFDSVVQDAVGTELKTIPVRPVILNCAKAYLAAYEAGFIRMDLVADENVDRGIVDALTESLREAQSWLVKFLRSLTQSIPEPGVCRIIIDEENEIEVDGKPREFTGAALRVVLVLGLLHEQSEFRLQEFAKLYHGKDVEADIAKTDFDNAMKALKKELPSISSSTPSKNYRTVTGIKFLVAADPAQINKKLSAFYIK